LSLEKCGDGSDDWLVEEMMYKKRRQQG